MGRVKRQVSHLQKARETLLSQQQNDDTNNDESNENESLNQVESSIMNNETSIPAPPNPSSVNQTALRREVSKLDAVDKSSQNTSINNVEEDNNMDIDENQQEQEIGISQAQIEPVSDESKNQSISSRPSHIPRFNRNSNSLASAPSTSTNRLNSAASHTFSESKIPSHPYHRKRDRVSSNLSPPATVPPINLNLPPPATILSPFVSNQVPNQDIQLDIESIDLNEGVTNQTHRVASINTSTSIPSNNSNSRPAISATTLIIHHGHMDNIKRII